MVFGKAWATREYGKSTTVHIPNGVLANQEPGKPANILLIGNDSREFVSDAQDAQAFGQKDSSQHSDTMMILHVDPDTKTALVVSLPRDLEVEIPGHGHDKLNAAFAIGGPTLLINTIQQSLGIKINHYLAVNFVGFKNIVDAIGKVKVYFPTPVHDPFTGLDIEHAGCVALNGDQARAYVRSRHYYIPKNLKDPAPWVYHPVTLSDGEQGGYANGWVQDPLQDIHRIPRQQYFIRTLSQAAIDKTASNPLKIFGLLDAVVSNLSHDQGLTESQMRALVRTFRGLNPATVQMTTLPNEQEGNNGPLVVKEPEADTVVQHLNNFQVPKGLPRLLPPAQIKVRVINGSGVQGRARAALDEFVAHGFKSGGPAADADRSDYPVTQVRYAPGQEAKGVTVAVELGTTNYVQAASAKDALGGDVLVVIGRDYPNLKGLLKEPASSTTSTAASQGSNSSPSSTTTTTLAQSTTVDTRYVPVDPKTGGTLVGCPS